MKPVKNLLSSFATAIGALLVIVGLLSIVGLIGNIATDEGSWRENYSLGSGDDALDGFSSQPKSSRIGDDTLVVLLLAIVSPVVGVILLSWVHSTRANRQEIFGKYGNNTTLDAWYLLADQKPVRCRMNLDSVNRTISLKDETGNFLINESLDSANIRIKTPWSYFIAALYVTFADGTEAVISFTTDPGGYRRQKRSILISVLFGWTRLTPVTDKPVLGGKSQDLSVFSFGRLNEILHYWLRYNKAAAYTQKISPGTVNMIYVLSILPALMAVIFLGIWIFD